MGDVQVDDDGGRQEPSFSVNSVEPETWIAAEEGVNEILSCIHPTLDAEEGRKNVIEYLQRLIVGKVGCEVFPYGSVPLKTFLPDGDIDLTVLSIPDAEASLPQQVLAILLEEEENDNAEYKVTSTQFIDAEVKLVKSLVHDIVVDISFNQLGGLCTLCFLEQVDRYICKDHLFKRSIILIKAWCYYESRILGAHCGLISTYALETLVLYIFQVSGVPLNGPLMVLYKFLEYFSRFDWDKYCISLDGPVFRAYLPDIVFEKLEVARNKLLLSGDFLKNCFDMFCVPFKENENSRVFAQKNLNIIDPLKANNNLGRSVHRANYFRILSAFRLGARRLGQILSVPRDDIADEIKLFFKNTLDIHGRNCVSNSFCALSIPSCTGTPTEDEISSKLSNLDFDDDISIGVEGKTILGSTKGHSSLSGQRVAANASNDLATFRPTLLRSTKGTSDRSQQGSSQMNGSQSGMNYNAPPYYARSFTGTWNLESLQTNSADSGILSQDENNVLDILSLDFREKGFTGSVGEFELTNPLSDLTGDYYCHIRSLLYGQCCHGFALFASILCGSPPPTPQPPPPPPPLQMFQNIRPWETIFQPMPFDENPFFLEVPNGPVEVQQSYYTQPNPTSCWEERRNVRGTGTYLPNTNGCFRGRGGSRGRGRNRTPRTNYAQFQRRPQNHAWSVVNSSSRGSSEVSSEQSPRQSQSTFGNVNHQSNHTAQDIASRDPITKGNSHHPPGGNSDAIVPSNSHWRIAFGSVGPLPEEASNFGDSNSSAAALLSQGSELIFGKIQQRVTKESFGLKNEEEFPPLSA